MYIMIFFYDTQVEKMDEFEINKILDTFVIQLFGCHIMIYIYIYIYIYIFQMQYALQDVLISQAHLVFLIGLTREPRHCLPANFRWPTVKVQIQRLIQWRWFLKKNYRTRCMPSIQTP